MPTIAIGSGKMTFGVNDLDDAFEEMNTAFREAVEYPNPFRKPKS